MTGIQYEHKELRVLMKAESTPALRKKFKLHPWQELGVAFLDHCRKKYGYAILADEMGVGKVIFLHLTGLIQDT